jgi:hydroxymethylpyrimidine/phosphomethylpyrimidine kinase
MSGTWGDPVESRLSTSYFFQDVNGETLGHVISIKQHHAEGDVFSTIGNNMLKGNNQVHDTVADAKAHVEACVAKEVGR